MQRLLIAMLAVLVPLISTAWAEEPLSEKRALSASEMDLVTAGGDVVDFSDIDINGANAAAKDLTTTGQDAADAALSSSTPGTSPIAEKSPVALKSEYFEYAIPVY